MIVMTVDKTLMSKTISVDGCEKILYILVSHNSKYIGVVFKGALNEYNQADGVHVDIYEIKYTEGLEKVGFKEDVDREVLQAQVKERRENEGHPKPDEPIVTTQDKDIVELKLVHTLHKLNQKLGMDMVSM